MKNYSINEYQKKSFILNYCVKDNNIIVNLANGNNYMIPYSIENEKMILERMRDQVIDSKEFYDNIVKKEKKYEIIMFLLCFFTINIYYFMGMNILMPFLYAFSIKSIWDYVNISKYVDDYKKNLLFINNSDIFKSNNITKKDLLDVSKKTRKIMKEHDITLNDLDNIDYEDIAYIVKNHNGKRLTKKK